MKAFPIVLVLMLATIRTVLAGVTPAEVKEFNDNKMKAEKGDPSAQFITGVNFENGLGVGEDLVQAVVWYRKAADKGHAEAQTTLGHLYNVGAVVARDVATAASWWRKAAEQGNHKAQAYLGYCYHEGKGVAKDDIEAYAFWSLARINNREANTELSNLEKGMSINQISAGKKRAREIQDIIDVRRGSNKPVK